MKRLATGALAGLVLLTFAVPAFAQLGNTFGQIYFSVDDNAVGDNFNQGIAAFGQFEFYLVIEVDFADDGRGEQNVTNGVFGWEGTVNFPSDITVLGRELRPATALNFGTGDPNNFIVGTGVSINAVNTPYGFVKFTAGLFVPTPGDDYLVTLSEAVPASQGATEPLWLEFLQDPKIHRFTNGTTSTFTVNCTVDCGVATGPTTFGRVKSEF